MKAYLVTVTSFSSEPVVIFSESKSKATWRAVVSLMEAFGVTPREALMKVRVRRAKEYEKSGRRR